MKFFNILTVIFLFLFLSKFIFPQKHLIASFNTLRLGTNKKDLLKTADSLKDFSLVGLTEVMSKKGLEELADILCEVTGDKWSYHISSYPVGNSSYKEYFAFIWKDSHVSLLDIHGFYPDPNNNFSREPYGASFKIENFDFIFVLTHLVAGTKKSKRESEAFYLNNVYSFFEKINNSEKDIIIAGDFNLPGDSYFFTSLKEYSNYNIVSCIDPAFKTTIGKNDFVNSYDNFFLSLIHTKEYTGINGVIDFTNNKFVYSKKFISDHLPVFIEIDGSFDDD